MDKGDIYQITNKINGKSYVGQAICYTIKGYKHGYLGRWKTHIREANGKNNECRALNNAIRKYGAENFEVELLHRCDIKDMDQFEEFYIWFCGTLCPNGYNIRTGGSKGKHCQESRELMRQKKLGKNNHNYGKPRTNETKRKISQAKSGSKHHFYGKHLSKQHKLNLSKSHKKYDSDLPMYIAFIKARPQYYQASGYAVINHPSGKKKYFTSKKMSNSEKYKLALKFLKQLDKECPN